MSNSIQNSGAPRRLKILYAGLKYDYGDPHLGLSYEYLNLYETMLKSGEYNVEIFPFDEIMRDVGRERMNQLLLQTVDRSKPDCCFFVLFTDEIKKGTIRHITEKSGCVTFNWFCDDHWRFDIYSKKWAPLFHWVSTTDSAAVEKYKERGYNNVIKTQWGFNPATDRRIDHPYEHDVTFIGQVHSNRRKTLDRLKEEKIELYCRGKGWNGGRLSHDEMVRAYQASRINLNFAQSSLVPGLKTIAKIFLNRRADDTYRLNNPLQWVDNFKIMTRRQRPQIKARNFEITGHRGFLLTEDADNLSEYFRPGSDIAIFSGFEDLREKILYYLSHEAEREAIRNAGYQRTMNDHTYENRLSELFKSMKLR